MLISSLVKRMRRRLTIEPIIHLEFCGAKECLQVAYSRSDDRTFLGRAAA